ncbi:MAG: macro domain-containing protein [Ruminococcus sp.]|nr:macro domain-containing protein [Ruminococcus sp.]
MDLAKNNSIRSIVFPAISTGVYGYPEKHAAEVSMKAITDWLNNNKGYDITVIICCYNRNTYDIYRQIIE